MRLSDGLARAQLAELYRAKEELRDELGADVMKGIDAKLSKLLDGKYNLTGREGVRKITVAETERHAAVLDLHDVMGDMFKKVNFKEGFIKGKSGLPKVVRKFFSDVQLTDDQPEVWQRLQQLDEERKAVRE